MKYVIDPYFCSFDDGMSKDEVEDFVKSIMELDKIKRQHRDDMFILSRMQDILYENGLYPLYQKLNPLLKEYNLDYEYRDIARVLEGYFKLSCIDEEVQEDSLEKKEELICPEASYENRPEVFQTAFKDVLWHTYCYHRKNNIESDAIVIYSRNIDATVDVNYSIYEVNENAEDNTYDVDASFCCYSLFAFYKTHDTPYKLWRYGTSKYDLDIGLRCRVMQEESMSEIDDVKDKYTFVLQDSFYEDFCNCRYACRSDVVRNTVENMAMVIMDRHVDEHNVKTKPTKGAPYQFHGDYSAMRRKCFGSLRVHYWKHTPSYRFANIGEHDLTNIKWEDD